MAKVYIGQTALQIRLNLNQNITDVYKRIIIKYKKPNGVRGFWPAEVLDPSIGLIAFTMDPDIDGFTDVGYWTVWAYVYFNDGSVIAGEKVQIGVYEQGKTYVAFPYGQLSHIGEGIIMAQEAFEIIYNNSESSLIAENVQDAIDDVVTIVNNIAEPTAQQIPYNNTVSQLPSTNVQGAIDSLDRIVDKTFELVSATNGIVYVDPNRTDVYTATGNQLTPFKSIAAALTVIQAGQVIQLAAYPYIETVELPDGVSLLGAEAHFTIINGQLTTGNYLTQLSNFTLNGNLITVGPVSINNVSIFGSATVANDFKTEYVTISPSTGVPLTVTGGNIFLNSVHIQANDNSSAIIQHAGKIYLSTYAVSNNSSVNATIYSDGGTLVALNGATVTNASGGLSLSVNNSGLIGSPNVLSNLIVAGNVVTGTAYTIIESLQYATPITISGTNIVLNPASFTGYNVTKMNVPSTFLPSINPVTLLPTSVQDAIDFVWSNCKSGTINPTYTPLKTPELYVNIVTNTLWIWTGVWHYVLLT